MKKYATSTLIVFAFCALTTRPAFGVSKEMLYIMQTLDTLSQKVDTLQKNMDAQAADMRNLIGQVNKNLISMKSTVADLQKATDQALASNNARFDSMTGQVQAFSEGLEEVKSRLAKLSDQVAQTQNIIQTLNTPAPAPTNPSTLPSAGDPRRPGANIPDADALYKSASSYYNGGQFQLAIQAYQEFMQYYGDTDRASTAQYYIGECYYSLGDYSRAIEEYNKCLERYPDGKQQPPAQLKKGYALLALGQRQAGVRELRSLVQRHPNSHEAELALQRLKGLGYTVSRRRGE